MNFITDFMLYNKGNECPQTYIMWAAYATLSTAIGPRVALNCDYFLVLPDLMICLVGESGNRKSFALTRAANMLREVIPDIILCADQETIQGITNFMKDDAQVRVCIDYTGARTTYRPYGCFASELGNWIALNPEAFALFLTDIKDKYQSGYVYRIKNELHVLPHPYFTMLACTVPELITRKIKGAEFCSGFGRRIVFVCNTEEILCKPVLSEESKLARERCVKRLREILNLHGMFKLADGVDDYFWTKWYKTRKRPTDNLLKAQFRTEHLIVLQLAMLTSIAERDDLTITFRDLQVALAIWYENKKHMPLLTTHLGRSELVEADAFVFDQLRLNGGKMRETQLMRATFHQFRGSEQKDYFNYLQRAGKIVVRVIDNHIYYCLPEKEKDDNERQDDTTTLPEVPQQPDSTQGGGTPREPQAG